MAIQRLWIHGNAGLLERRNAPRANTKDEVEHAFERFDGDLVNLGNFATAAFLRIGFEGRVVIYDHGSANNAKSGGFWMHYALPTIATADARVRQIYVRYHTADYQKIAIRHIHLWDGNRERLYVDNDVDENMRYAANVNKRYQGALSVSLFVSANHAKNDILSIYEVGVEVDV